MHFLQNAIFQEWQSFEWEELEWLFQVPCLWIMTWTQPAKLDLNKKSLPKQKTIQNFTIDAQGFRKINNENSNTWEMGVTS